MADQSAYPGALDGVPTDRASGDIIPSNDWNLYFDGVRNIENYAGVSGTAVAATLTYQQDTLRQAVSADRTENIRFSSGGGAGNTDINLYFATDAPFSWQEASDRWYVYGKQWFHQMDTTLNTSWRSVSDTIGHCPNFYLDHFTVSASATAASSRLGQIHFRGVDSTDTATDGASIFVEQQAQSSGGGLLGTSMWLRTNVSAGAANDNHLVLWPNGYVGINTSAAVSMLHVYGGDITMSGGAAASRQINFSNNAAIVWNHANSRWDIDKQVRQEIVNGSPDFTVAVDSDNAGHVGSFTVERKRTTGEVTQNNDYLAHWYFYGTDSASAKKQGAELYVRQDGNAGAGGVPVEMVLQTYQADGTQNTDQLVLHSSDGYVGIGTKAPVSMLHVYGGDLTLSGAANADRYINFASDANILWDESHDEFDVTHPINIAPPTAIALDMHWDVRHNTAAQGVRILTSRAHVSGGGVSKNGDTLFAIYARGTNSQSGTAYGGYWQVYQDEAAGSANVTATQRFATYDGSGAGASRPNHFILKGKNGYVGINTASPAQMLHVYGGNIDLRGAANADSSVDFASDARILWDESEDAFQVPKPINSTQTKIRAYPNAARQTVNSAAVTQVTLDAESFDMAGEFAGNTFTAVDSGYYHCHGQVGWYHTMAASAIHAVYLYVAGAASAQFADAICRSDLAPYTQISDVFLLTAGQTVDMRCYYSDGANATRDLSNDSKRTFLTIHKIV